MKITKIILALLILVCAIGMVAATDISKMKTENGYMNLGDGSYGSEADDVEIDIEKPNESFIKDYFENDSDVKYRVEAGKLNNTFNFTDNINDMIGVIELVEIDGENYVIDFWTDTHAENTTMDRFYDALEEFNKLNNITPLDPKILDD